MPAPRKSTASSRRRPSRTSARLSKPSGRYPRSVVTLGIILALIVIAAVALLIVTAGKSNSKSDITHELPEGAMPTAQQLMDVKNPDGLRQKLLHYTAMDISFNRDTHQPNWVAWELLGSEVSTDVSRESGFSPDPEVDGCAVTEDYRHTGFDRGHMAPAGDMKWDKDAMRESFYMTNICPQSPDLNRGAWKKLEEKCRVRAQADSSLIIVCGPIFDKSGPSARLGGTGVAVPSKFFKVILAPYVPKPWAIGFVMPNGYVQGGMQKAAVPVDSVESLTGYDFFHYLPDDIETVVEARCDFNSFSRVRR